MRSRWRFPRAARRASRSTASSSRSRPSPPASRSSRGVFATTDFSSSLYVGLSLLAHVGLIAAMAFFVPPMGLTDDEGLSRDQQYLIQQYLQAAAEREQEEKETEQVAETNADNKEGGTGHARQGRRGLDG